MPNITPNHDTKVVLTTIAIVSALLLGAWAAKAYFTPPKSPGIGEQFTEADLEGGDGRLVSIPTACDATTIMIPSLYNEGFLPYSMGSANDVTGKQFAMTFWKRLSVGGLAIIVTTSHDSGVTCIISISNNVTDIRENDGTDGQKVTPNSNTQEEPTGITPV
jgi:hypothetical protein